MKICIVPAGYMPIPATKGGAVETLVQNIINKNEECGELAITVLSVYDDKAQKIANTYKNCDVVFFKGRPKIDKIYFWFFYKTLKKFINIILPDYYLKLKMIKYIGERQDQYDWIIFEGGEIDCLKYYRHYINSNKIIIHSHGEIYNKKHLDYCYKYYLAVSEFVGKAWNSTVNRDNEYCITLKNGVNTSDFNKKLSSKEKYSLKKKLGIKDNDFVIMFIGRIVPEKGVKELIKAVGLLKEDVKLLIVGSSTFGIRTKTMYEKEVQELVDKQKDKIIFTGYVDNKEAYKYYNISDIISVPSMFNDPAPLVIIESMAAGIPIVTTGSGGIKEFCDEECAIFIDRDDDFCDNLARTINYLKSNPDIREKMSEHAKKVSQNYTLEKYYSDFVNILNNISKG